ncbi:MAG: AraC family transcriptional regulator [Pseudomonadota bacterium]
MNTSSRADGLTERVYPPFKALSLLRGMAALGEATDALVDDLSAGSDLTLKTIEHPSARISLAQLQSLYAAAAAPGSPDLALRLGATMSPTDYGPYGYAIMTASTFGEGLRFMEEFIELETPAAQLSVEFNAAPARHAIRCDDAMGDPTVSAFITELYLAMVFTFAKELHGPAFRFDEIQTRRPRPGHAGAYGDLFECPCRFEMDRDAMLFPAALWDAPMRRSNPVTHALMRAQCEEAAATLRGARRLSGRVAALIAEDPRRFRAIAAAADALGLSARTLQRRLEAEGASFTELSAQARIELAMRILRRREASVDDVAWRLGYSSTANFRTAFKRRTGLTIRGFLGHGPAP